MSFASLVRLVPNQSILKRKYINSFRLALKTYIDLILIFFPTPGYFFEPWYDLTVPLIYQIGMFLMLGSQYLLCAQLPYQLEIHLKQKLFRNMNIDLKKILTCQSLLEALCNTRKFSSHFVTASCRQHKWCKFLWALNIFNSKHSAFFNSNNIKVQSILFFFFCFWFALVTPQSGT